MRDLPLNALRAFAAVYTHGGVRAAARELGVAHSSISRHLVELDRWLGVPLIREGHRGRGGLTFTAQGEALGRATLAGLRGIEQTIASMREARSGRSVTIATAPSFAARWLLPRLSALESSLPRIEISIVVEQKLVDPDAADVDFAIRMGRGPWPGLRCEPLMDEVLYPVMSADFWKRSRRPSRPEDLVRLRLLHDRDPNATWELWRRAHGPRSLNVRNGPRFASSDLVLRAAEQGHGVALARHRLAMQDVSSGRLLRPLGSLQVAIGPAYWLVLPQRPRHLPAVSAVIDWLREQGQSDATKFDP
ncbi:LysR substrate-binding domain-containing protein [Steroidobacter cummioxidans]|uniref:LysR substrate-binding domain-containing protein n=1 Tax=Steroidobacter cummioxidans TaxID=1803913 RepID=UPI000E3172EA|nr:LysR substrate-binding domain-containing protein [Steroidobacter cummioxidans]